MPLKGLIGKDGVAYSFDEALALAQAGDDRFPYPYPLLKGMVGKQNDRPADMISATSILHCIRAEYLKRVTDYSVQPEALYPAFRGTLFHALMEKNAPPNARIEERHKRVHRGIEITGQFDSLLTYTEEDPATHGKRYVLEDWKTTKSLPRYGSPYSSHIQQWNIYRWLLNLPVDNVVGYVWYFDMDGFVRTQLKDGSGRSKVSQIWTDQQVESFLDDRLVKLKASLLSQTPMPYIEVMPDEKWECDYCPVRNKCASLAEEEAENRFARRHGMDPSGEYPATAVWDELVMATRAKIVIDARPTRRKKETPK